MESLEERAVVRGRIGPHHPDPHPVALHLVDHNSLLLGDLFGGNRRVQEHVRLDVEGLLEAVLVGHDHVRRAVGAREGVAVDAEEIDLVVELLLRTPRRPVEEEVLEEVGDAVDLRRLRGADITGYRIRAPFADIKLLSRMGPLYILLEFRPRIRGRSVIDASKTKKVSGFTVTADPGFLEETDALLALLKTPEKLRSAQVIKSNMVRTVYEVEAAGASCILKRYHSAGPVNAFKYLLVPTRARTEWSVMRRFNELGIPTARPLAFGERRCFGFLADSFFAMSAIEDTRQFLSFISEQRSARRWNEADRNALYGKLAALAARLHEVSAFHADFHLGNVLVRGRDGADTELFVIDLHTVSFPRRLARRRAVLNLARVAEGLRSLGREDVAASSGVGPAAAWSGAPSSIWPAPEAFGST